MLRVFSVADDAVAVMNTVGKSGGISIISDKEVARNNLYIFAIVFFQDHYTMQCKQ